MNVHFSDRAFDYQTLRAVAYTTFGGAEPGEVLATAERIEEGDTESWFAAWRSTADRLNDHADSARADGRARTASGAFLRAHNYYRTAEFFLPPDDPRRTPIYESSRELFRSGIALSDVSMEPVEIPYERTALPGYLFSPETIDGSVPTIVCLGGFDSTVEELYFLCGVPEALAHGYAVLAFEGPGQGAPLREQGLTARPDWEHVVGPVLDFLEGRAAIDQSRIGVIGVSFGGYYAPRAAAFDDRIAACVAFDHMHDLYRASAFEHPRLAELFARLPDAVVDGVASLGERFSVQSRWLMANSRWVFDVDSAAELQRTLRRYSLSGIAGQVDCPTLVLAGEDDHFVPVDLAYEFVDELGGPATLRVFTREEGAAEHCQVGNLRLATGVVYDWLDETLAAEQTSEPGVGTSNS